MKEKKKKDNYITLTIMMAMTPMTIRKSNAISNTPIS